MALNCTDPGAVQDWELEAYADGEALPHVEEHLGQCAACRALLTEYTELDHRLRRALHRFDCPSPDLLRDYHWGYVSDGERRQVEIHLDTCPHCTAELADLAQFVAPEPAHRSSAVLDRARQAAAQVGLVVARLVSPVPRPELALRGDTQEVLLFEAADFGLSVHLEQGSTGTYTLFGQVLSPEVTAPAGGHARLTPREENAAAIQASIDANGSFALTDLRPGIYQLIASWPDRRIVVPTLALESEL